MAAVAVTEAEAVAGAAVVSTADQPFLILALASSALRPPAVLQVPLGTPWEGDPMPQLRWVAVNDHLAQALGLPLPKALWLSLVVIYGWFQKWGRVPHSTLPFPTNLSK